MRTLGRRDDISHRSTARVRPGKFAKPMTTTSAERERLKRVHARAHAIWEKEGRPEGKHLAHWRRAQRLVAADELRAMAAALDPDTSPCPSLTAYFDHIIVSGRIREDMAQSEREAVQHLIAAQESGGLHILTARDYWPEQLPPDPRRLAAGLPDRTNLPPVHDNHGLVRLEHSRDGRGALVATPLPAQLVDVPLFAKLANTGLEPACARHLMNAVANRCDRFVTLNASLRHDMPWLALCRGLIMVTPSALAAEIRNARPSAAASQVSKGQPQTS
jgi:hypothetical protein